MPEERGRLSPQQVRRIRVTRLLDRWFDRMLAVSILFVALFHALVTHNYAAASAWLMAGGYVLIARSRQRLAFAQGWYAGGYAAMELAVRGAGAEEFLLVYTNPPSYQHYMDGVVIDLVAKRQD